MENLIKKHDLLNRILNAKFLNSNHIDATKNFNNDTVPVLNLVLYLALLLLILPVITAILMVYLGIF